MITTDTTTKMEQWLAYRKMIDDMTAKAEELKKEIEAEGREVKIPGAECIETFKGTYDWEHIAMTFDPDDNLVEKFTSTAWNKVAEAAAPSKKELEEVKKQYYDQGVKFWQLRIVKEK